MKVFDTGCDMVFSSNHDRFKLEVTGTVSEAKPHTVKLAMAMGVFSDSTISEDREEFWGPIHLPRLPHGVPNTCRIATAR